RRPLARAGQRAGVLRTRQGVLGGALRNRARRRPAPELLLHRFHHGSSGPGSRRTPACGTSGPTAAAARAASRLADPATPTGRVGGGVTGGRLTSEGGGARGEKGLAAWDRVAGRTGSGP